MRNEKLAKKIRFSEKPQRFSLIPFPLSLISFPFSFFLFLFYLLLFTFYLFSCSSAPKKATEIYTIRNTASSQLILANETASHGRYEDALVTVEGARQLAVSADDPPLRIKTSISRGNILFSLGRGHQALEELESAAVEADAAGEKSLAAQARISIIRVSVMQLTAENTAENVTDNAATAKIEEYKDSLTGEMAAVRSDQFATADGYVTLGMVEKGLGNWAEAESALRRALDVHVKNLSLEAAAYDWFIIASIRSMAGNYDSALEALRTAIGYDRRAENGFGLASSWQAMGEVLEKAGRTEESRDAWHRAAEIYRAISMKDLAEKLEGQLLP